MRVLIIGAGNELREDDGIGSRIVRLLREQGPLRGADFHLLERDLFEIAGSLDAYDRMVIVDAIPPAGSPGRIEAALYSARTAGARKPHSLHDMDFFWQLRVLSAFYTGPILLIGVEAASLDFADRLSPALAALMPFLTARVRAVIGNFLEVRG